MKKTVFCILVLLLIVFQRRSSADLIYGGEGCIVYPLNGAENIVLVDKRVDIKNINGYFQADCIYTFHNRGDKINVKMGFPDFPDAPYADFPPPPLEEFQYPIKDFTCYVDGSNIDVEEILGMSHPEINPYLRGPLYNQTVPKMYVFNVEFEKDQVRTVRNKYKFRKSIWSIGDGEISYSLAASPLWKGDIQKARISITGLNAPLERIKKEPSGYEIREGSIIWEFKGSMPEKISIYYNKHFLRAVASVEKVMNMQNPDEKDIISLLELGTVLTSNERMLSEHSITENSSEYFRNMAKKQLEFIRLMPEEFSGYEYYPRIYYYLGKLDKARKYSYKYLDGLHRGEYDLRWPSTLPQTRPLIEWIARYFSKAIEDDDLSNYAIASRPKEGTRGANLRKAKQKKHNYEQSGDTAKDEKQYEEAIENYKKSLDVYNIDMESWDDFFKSLTFQDGTSISDFLIHQENRRRASLLYKIGIIYETELENKEKAKEYYSKLIEKYPEEKYIEKVSKRLDILNYRKD